ncbi:MAG: S8 family serine peptidase [Acidimicrobiia bacterium]|nr:S8 family serine peptidase [Acidimicrobiia bacterium]
MRVTRDVVWAVLAVLILVMAGCTSDSDPEPEPGAFVEDLDVLWAATFGDPAGGSYSRYTDSDETNWRSRYQYADMTTMLPGSGVGDCGSDVNLPIGLFNLRQVYLFNGGGKPVGPPPEFRVGERPGIEFGPDGNGELDNREQTLPAIELPVPDNPTREDFIRAANALLVLAAESGVEDPQLALDYVLSPTMFHGHGSEDPTEAASDATSESLTAAADATSSGAEGSTIWVIDFGLPADADVTWPGNISGSQTQPRPPTDRLTSQYAHGLMVASAAAQAAPSASVEVIDVAYDIAGGNEAISVRSIDQGLLSTGILQDAKNGVLNFSIGSYHCPEVVGDDGSLLELNDDPQFDALLAVLEPYLQRVPVVAAVGNDVTSEVLYPAGFDDVIGVAAIDETVPNTEACLDPEGGIFSWSPASSAPETCTVPSDPREAPFNNTSAVKEFRVGVDLVVDYPTFSAANGGPVEYNYYGDDEKPYAGNPISLSTGKVRMSGTSLAAPVYAACLAGSSDGNPVC